MSSADGSSDGNAAHGDRGDRTPQDTPAGAEAAVGRQAGPPWTAGRESALPPLGVPLEPPRLRAVPLEGPTHLRSNRVVSRWEAPGRRG